MCQQRPLCREGCCGQGDPTDLSPSGLRELVPTSKEQVTPVILAYLDTISGSDPIRPCKPNKTRLQQQLAGRFPGKRSKQAAFSNLTLCSVQGPCKETGT